MTSNPTRESQANSATCLCKDSGVEEVGARSLGQDLNDQGRQAQGVGDRKSEYV